MNANYGNCKDNCPELVCESINLSQISQHAPSPPISLGATMADILQDFPVHARPHRVFEAISTPDGLNNWWTRTSAGKPIEGTEYELNFTPDYHWRAVVACCVTDSEFELQITKADGDWTGTFVGFRLEAPREENLDPVPALGLARAQRTLPCLVPLLGDVSADPEAISRIRRDRAVRTAADV